jgi:mono/diheme cytochrome c family protein
MMRRMPRVLITLLPALAGLVSVAAYGADVQAGRRAALSKCGQCHEADDWEGEGAASLESLIQDIVAGKVKHKDRLELTPAEVANIAAYWAAGEK